MALQSRMASDMLLAKKFCVICYDLGHVLFVFLTPEGGAVLSLCCLCLCKLQVEAEHWWKTK